MVVFHFTYDLQLFGYAPPGTVFSPGWQIFARAVAGSFIFLAGFSLYLAHRDRIHWRKALHRLALLAAAAALVTGATYVGMPDQFIYFGILHSITVSSVIGLAFLRLPASVTLIAGAAVLAMARGLHAEFFNAPMLLWLGLGTETRRAMDFEPTFPWLAPLLFGLAVAKLLAHRGLLARLSDQAAPSKGLRLLAWPGQHSLAIYLCHQPILIGLLWCVTQLIG